MSDGARPPRISWPDGKAFALAIFDDTDLATLENVRPVYDFLETLGIRSTKSVWPITGTGTPAFGGATCDDPDYAAWTRELQASGFEIGLHGATFVTSTREETKRGLDRYRELYGHDPAAHANHSGCAESIYWGADRITGLNRLVYNVITRFRRANVFRGHREGDPLFWGDLCRERLRYVRNFTFQDIDTLAACPQMPYHDPDRPYVQEWFAGSEGSSVEAFNTCLADRNVERLQAAGSACIMYTHFAAGFYRDGRLDPVFQAQMTRLSQRNGWFVPVSELLDHIRSERGPVVITPGQRDRIERRWLGSKLRVGHT
ncbi:MAG TPA: hypothetical protein VFY18_08875 [Candidatus Limnocylindrales bacterium]|nr:hypothetical protein [Candidatus Limnocylindrales bacterium]